MAAITRIENISGYQLFKLKYNKRLSKIKTPATEESLVVLSVAKIQS